MIEKNEEMKKIIKEKIKEEFGKKAEIYDIVETIIKQKAIILDFQEPDVENMLDIDEKEKIASDTNLFRAYNLGIKSIFGGESLDKESENLYENVIKFQFKGKEIVVGFQEDIDYAPSGRSL